MVVAVALGLVGAPLAALPPTRSRPVAPVAAPSAQVQAWAERYSTGRHRATLLAALRRATPYAGMVAAKLQACGLPGALIYLPVLESGYDATATSRAGARGLWQFMPGTARALGLAVDAWQDERLDAWRATDAACRYLRDLYATTGAWPTALASYNAGPGRLQRAGAGRGGASFWRVQAALPVETQHYVPALLGLVAVGTAPAQWGLGQVPGVGTTLPPWGRVWVGANTRLAAVAAPLGVDPAVLRALNPALLRGQTPPTRGAWVVVPLSAGRAPSAPLPVAAPDSVGADSVGAPAAAVPSPAPRVRVPVVTSGYGRRVAPRAGASTQHAGLDLKAVAGTPVVAPWAGTVTAAGWASGYGLRVVVCTPSRWCVRLGHLSAVTVPVGAAVAAGTLVGRVGATGVATGPHLHYEIRSPTGAAVDPVASGHFAP